MTKADAARLVAIVVTAYPNFDKFKDAKAIEATVNLWAMMFEQDESTSCTAPDNSTTEISPASFRLWWRGPLSQSAGLPSGKCTAVHT